MKQLVGIVGAVSLVFVLSCGTSQVAKSGSDSLEPAPPKEQIERTTSTMDSITLPSHPRLLLNTEEIELVRERIATHDWAQIYWNQMQDRANKVLEQDVALPPRGGNWWHWYACPEHGTRLRTGDRIGEWQWEHKCPVGGEVLLGDTAAPKTDYDGCVIQGVHDNWSKAVLDLALTYAISEKQAYADKAREILLAYAERYKDYPLHTIHGEEKIGGGRVGAQTLDESVWLIPICQGADLIWDTLSEQDKHHLAEGLLLPAVTEVIVPHKMGIHNIQCWKNSAVGLVGFLLGDKKLIQDVIDDPERGFRQQISKGVLPDGIWWEGAWGYHFYTLLSLWSLTEAALNCGIDLYDPSFKSMYDGPLRFAMPNLLLPAFNDSGTASVKGSAPNYELAFRRFQDPEYSTVLETSNRNNDKAFLFGAMDIPPAPSKKRQSVNYPQSGYAILQRGLAEAATWLCFKYGPHGGGHGHPDKLSFVLYARGEILGVDPGTALYGLPIQNGWYKTSLAHNTLIVDGKNQTPAEGTCLVFGSEADVDYAQADAGAIYDGVKFHRTVALFGEDLLVFIDQIESETEHVYDVAYHQSGVWTDIPFGKAWTPEETPGYAYLQDALIRSARNPVSLHAQTQGKMPVTIGLFPDRAIEVITATGVGAHVNDRVPMAVFRQRASSTCFVWAIVIGEQELPALRLLQTEDADGKIVPAHSAAAVSVEREQGTCLLLANPKKSYTVVSLPNGSRQRTDEAVFVKALK